MFRRNESTGSDDSFESESSSGGSEITGSPTKTPGSPTRRKQNRPRAPSNAVVALRSAVSSENQIRKQVLEI